ncbi:MAG: hypothetical protein JXO72_10290 [Vicinamibacteria bacterium]|nr:hypothetical protein [Vicinamibacteria bacterium]
MKRALPALPALLAGLISVYCILAPGVDILPYRGGERFVEVFHHGRWDALHLVARQPARVCVPVAPARLTLVLSGPAQVVIQVAGIEHRMTLDGTPLSCPMVIDQLGCMSIEADRAVRLHHMRIERFAAPSWMRLIAILLALAASCFVSYRTSGLHAWIPSLVVSAGALLTTGSGFSGIVLSSWIARLTPAALVLLLAASFLVVMRLPSNRARASAMARPSARAETRLAMSFGGLALVSCLAQVLLLDQPLIESDPWAYWDIGGRFREALSAVRGPDSLADALLTIRPLLVMPFTGLLYAAMRAIADHPTTVYCLHSVAMAAAVGLLARTAGRIGGSRLALIVGALAVLYPTFPIICGIVQPEPLILLCWTFALDRLLVAREQLDIRAFGLAGMAFGGGLALHPQGLWFLLLASLVAIAPFGRRLFSARNRTALGAFALGVMPLTLVTAAGETYARPTTHVLAERYGFWAYKAPCPLGFWIFIDDDGWQGTVRLNETRYGRDLPASGAVARLTYTSRFVVENAVLSLRTVLRNLHRLFHQPDNPFHRKWILPYSWQVHWHRALAALFLLAAPVVLAFRLKPILLPYAALSMTYPFYHVFNKYAVPATPFMLLGAGLAVLELSRNRSPSMIGCLLAAAIGAFFSPADLALRGMPPDPARWLLASLHWGGLAGAFCIGFHVWARDETARVATGIAATALLVPSFAAAWGDPSWRAFDLPLDRPAEHEVVVGEEGQRKLSAAREAYLVLDLVVPSGDPERLRIEFESGLAVGGCELLPTMPAFPLASTRGHRDPRAFRQWWRTPWRPEMATSGRVSLRIVGSADDRIGGDLATPDANSVYHGLSLGEWPYLSVYRLMHDGEYRIPVRRALAGSGYSSRWNGEPLPGTLRVRLLILDEDTGGAEWETTPAPTRDVVTAIWAEAGRQARADLCLPEGALRLDFQNPGRITGPAGEARFHHTGEYEGWHMIRTRTRPGHPLRITVRPLHEMSGVRRYFLPALREEHPPLPLDWAGVPYIPPVRILWARESPHWRPIVAY